MGTTEGMRAPMHRKKETKGRGTIACAYQCTPAKQRAATGAQEPSVAHRRPRNGRRQNIIKKGGHGKGQQQQSTAIPFYFR